MEPLEKENTGRMYCEHAAAKINLTLEVAEKEADGYHRLVSVFHSLRFGDDLELDFVPAELVEERARQMGEESLAEILHFGHFELGGGRSLGLCITGPQAFPAQENNSLVLALRLYQKAFGLPSSIALHLHKRIPQEAGLGGGSSDAAALLRLLARLVGPKRSDFWKELALQIGMDVPFCFQGGCALLRDRGAALEPLESISGDLLLVKPPFGMETRKAYREIDNMEEPLRKRWRPRHDQFLAAWRARNYEVALRQCANEFHAVFFRQYPEAQNAWTYLAEQAGREVLSMSGSGTAAFAFFSDSLSLEKAADSFFRAYPTWFQTITSLAPAENTGEIRLF